MRITNVSFNGIVAIVHDHVDVTRTKACTVSGNCQSVQPSKIVGRNIDGFTRYGGLIRFGELS